MYESSYHETPRVDLGLKKRGRATRLVAPNASNAGPNNRSRPPEFLDVDKGNATQVLKILLL